MAQVSGYGPEDWNRDETVFWDELTDDYDDLKNDRTAAELFSAGWLNPDLNNFSPAARNSIRDRFYGYATSQGAFLRAKEFDWEEWRRMMGY